MLLNYPLVPVLVISPLLIPTLFHVFLLSLSPLHARSAKTCIILQLSGSGWLTSSVGRCSHLICEDSHQIGEAQAAFSLPLKSTHCASCIKSLRGCPPPVHPFIFQTCLSLLPPRLSVMAHNCHAAAPKSLLLSYVMRWKLGSWDLTRVQWKRELTVGAWGMSVQYRSSVVQPTCFWKAYKRSLTMRL